MGLFRKKDNAPPADVNEPEPPSGPFEEIKCVFSVAKDGKNVPLEAEGVIRFFENEAAIYGPGSEGGTKGIAKEVFRQMVLPVKPKYGYQLRAPYTEISRAYFPKKRYIRLEMKDGKFAFLILNGENREAVSREFAAHGVTVEPYEG